MQSIKIYGGFMQCPRRSHRTPLEAGPAAHPARPADQLRPARRAKDPHLFQNNHTSKSACAPRRQGSGCADPLRRLSAL